MVSVFHNSKFLDFACCFKKAELIKKAKEINVVEDLLLVAEVKTSSLNKAYELTNHINIPWHLNKGVKAFMETRSTSIGDVLRIGNKQWIVGVCGFVEL